MTVLLQNKHFLKDDVRQAIAIAHRNLEAVAESLRHLNKR